VRRRDLFAMAAYFGASATSAARAQKLPMRRMAFVHSGIPAAQLTEASNVSWVRQFFAELRELGYAESANLTVERYSAEGRPERFAGLAAEIVARQPDLIVANQNPLVRALQKARVLSRSSRSSATRSAPASPQPSRARAATSPASAWTPALRSTESVFKS